MYCNQIYLGSGNYGFEAASEYYFSKPVGQLTLAEAATLAAIIRGPIYSPITHPDRALARRNLVLALMAHDRKITKAEAEAARNQPLGLHIESLRDDLAPYFVEEIRQYLEHTYGTAAVHEAGAARLHHAERRHAEGGGPGRARRPARVRPPARLARQPAEYSARSSRDNREISERRLATHHREGRLRHWVGDGRRAHFRIDQDWRVSRHAHARRFQRGRGKNCRREIAEGRGSRGGVTSRNFRHDGRSPARAATRRAGRAARHRQCHWRNQGHGRRLRF